MPLKAKINKIRKISIPFHKTKILDIEPIQIPVDEPAYKTAFALYNYKARGSDEVDFITGDIFTIYKEVQDWMIAKNCRSGQKGLIPANYVTMDDKESVFLEGWYNVDRLGAENKLLMLGVEIGMYIIRPGKGNDFPYALSIRGEGSDIVHFRIGYDQQTSSFYITPKIQFQSMHDLINYYKMKTIDGKVGLTEPRPPKVNPPLDISGAMHDLNKLEFLEELGSGNFGVVYKAKIGGVLLAVKRSKGEEAREAFLEEAKTMLVLKHPSIVQFQGIAEDSTDHSIIILSEYMENGSLKSYFSKMGSSYFRYIDLIIMIDTLVQGMVYLESLNVVHMDLRTENVLVNEQRKVKISDFGLTRILGGTMNAGSNKYPVRWTAPEIMKGQAKFTTKCDVWSFGVLMFEILTCGMLPYGNLTLEEVRQEVLNGTRLPSPVMYGFQCDGMVYETMKKCWDEDPEKRPSFKAIYLTTQKSIISKTNVYHNGVNTDKD